MVINGAAVCNSNNLDTCCQEILDAATATPGTLPSYIAPFVTCCNNVTGCASGDEGFPIQDAVCAGNCSQNDNQCFPSVDNDLPTFCGKVEYSGDAVLIQCVFDSDRDGYFDCRGNKTSCINLPVEVPKNSTSGKKGAKGGKCDFEGLNSTEVLALDATTSAGQTILCKLKFGNNVPVESLAQALNGVQQNSPNQIFTGTFCDCNDKDQHSHQIIACLQDMDGDGFIAVQQFYGNATDSTNTSCTVGSQVPICTTQCATKCAKGTCRCQTLHVYKRVLSVQFKTSTQRPKNTTGSQHRTSTRVVAAMMMMKMKMKMTTTLAILNGYNLERTKRAQMRNATI